MKNEIVLAFVGDVMLGRGVDDAITAHGPAYPWGNALDLLKAADLRLCNLECVIAESGRPAPQPRAFHFRAKPHGVDALTAAGFDFVALANNHILDFGDAALFETLMRLDEAGVARAGAGRDIAQARQPAMLTAEGLKVAVIAITDNEPDWLAGPERPGVNFVPISLEPETFGAVESAIADVAGRADLVVVAAHWGPNMVVEPPAVFRRFARAVLDAGCDIFYGHSAHVFQGVEIYKDKVIMYDTGDFVDDYAVDAALRNDLSFIFLVTVSVADGRVQSLKLVPTQISDYQATRAVGEEAEISLSKMADLSRPFHTEVERRDGALVINIDAFMKRYAI